MRKILSAIIIMAMTAAAQVMPVHAADITVPAGVTPADVVVNYDEGFSIPVTDSAARAARDDSNLKTRPDPTYPGYSETNYSGPKVAVETADQTFYVRCTAETAGKYNLSDWLGDPYGANRTITIKVNDIEVYSSTHYVHWLLRKFDRGTITLQEGMNKIQYTASDNYNTAMMSIILKTEDLAPRVGEISTSELKPFMGDTFTLTAETSDDVEISTVTYKIDGADTEVSMADAGNGAYTADLSIADAGEHTITITATDTSGQKASKDYAIEVVDFVIEQPATPIYSAVVDDEITYAGELTLRNSSGVPMNTCMIIAVYNSANQLVGFGKSDQLAGDGDIYLGVSVSVPVAPQGETYTTELMLWDDIWGMTELLQTPVTE